MPVLKIFYHETLDARIRQARNSMVTDLSAMLQEIMCAEPAKCQIIMSAAAHVSPFPVYIDLQYRANDVRTDNVLSQAMAKIAQLILHYLETGVRIRAFAIDQACLHALDVPSVHEQ